MPPPLVTRTDAELATALSRATAFARLVHVTACSSTMDLAAQDPVGDDAVFWADHQTRGRGRQQRPWLDGDGLDLAVTFRVRPKLPMPMALPAVVPLCVLEMLAAHGATGMRLKWPNDVLLAERKIAGVLIDAASHQPGVYFVGIGVNVNSQRLPDAVAHLATSLRLATGREHDRGELLLDLATRLDRALATVATGDVAGHEAAYRRHLGLFERRVVVRAGGEARGRLVGLDFHNLTLDDGTTFPLGLVQELRAE